MGGRGWRALARNPGASFAPLNPAPATRSIKARVECDRGIAPCRMDIHVRRMTMKPCRSEGCCGWQSLDKVTVSGQYLGHECPSYRSRRFGRGGVSGQCRGRATEAGVGLAPTLVSWKPAILYVADQTPTRPWVLEPVLRLGFVCRPTSKRTVAWDGPCPTDPADQGQPP